MNHLCEKQKITKSYLAELDMVEVGNLGNFDVEACADVADTVVDTLLVVGTLVDMVASMASSLYRCKIIIIIISLFVPISRVSVCVCVQSILTWQNWCGWCNCASYCVRITL